MCVLWMVSNQKQTQALQVSPVSRFCGSGSDMAGSAPQLEPPHISVFPLSSAIGDMDSHIFMSSVQIKEISHYFVLSLLLSALLLTCTTSQ